MAEANCSSRICFAEFEADLVTRELRRGGVKIDLQQQPFQVLAALLERPGELMTRDDFRRLVWGKDAFVDFERGLNKAINRLRDALGDRAKKPKIIETLPRRGYRLLPPVSRSIGSVAVLPFENLSGDPGNEYWADGITEELIARLGRVDGIRVISRTSCMHFKKSSVSLPDIAKQLHVEAIVEGSVALTDRSVRISAKLIHAPQDRLLWAGTYERSLSDVLTLQRQITRMLTVQLQARLTSRPQASQANVRLTKSAGYEAYLKGRFFWNKRTEPDLNSAIKHFRQAIVLDPKFAPAHAGLADSYTVLGILGILRPHYAVPKANSAAKAALELDEALAETHATLGHLHMVYDWDWRGAEKEFKKALKLNSNCSTARQWYAALLTVVGRNQEAVAEANRARDLDPLSIPANAFLGFVYMRARQYDLALRASLSAVDLDQNNPFGHWFLARVLDVRNELTKALAEAQRAVELSGSGLNFVAHLGYALARAGNRRRAGEIARKLIRISAKHYVSPYLLAIIYTGMRQENSAFEWLEKAYSDRAARLTELGDPPFDELRADARFQRLMRRVGLPADSATGTPDA